MPVAPEKLYSFTDFQTSRPADPIPGDRLDAQFENHAQAIRELHTSIAALLRSDGKLQNGIVDRSTLAVDLADEISTQFKQNIAGDLASASGASLVARASADAAVTARDTSIEAAQRAVQASHVLTDGKNNALLLIAEAAGAAQTLGARIETRANDLINDAKDAEGWGNYSWSWAQVSWRWAEYMSGPIPPDILAIMGISGAHWSSAWWANQSDQFAQSAAESAAAAADSASDAANSAASASDDADAAAESAADAAQIADDMDDLYLGAHPTPPTTDNDGDPLQTGAIYFDTTLQQTRVWNGTSWQALPAAGVSPAIDIQYTPNVPQAIAATNVQAAIDEVAAERLRDAPNDGEQYVRQSAAWAHVSVDYTDITGKPPTFPPGAHTHPISEVTGLQAALDSEASTRATNDTALASSISDNASAIAAEITNRTSADNALNAAKVAKTGDTMTGPLVVPSPPTLGTHAASKSYVDTQVATKVGPDAPADGLQYARKNNDWEKVTGGALIGPTPPAGALPNSFWWENDSANLFLKYDDGNSSQWVQVNYSPLASDYVKKAGDTMTGSLAIVPASTSPTLTLDKPTTATANLIYAKLAGANRWAMSLGTPDAEPGSNAGTNFALSRFSDAGAWIDDCFTINRATAGATFLGQIIAGPQPSSGHGLLNLNKSVSGKVSQIAGTTNGSGRWTIVLGDTAAESGAQAGSNFLIYRHNDSGAGMDTPFTIARASGKITMSYSTAVGTGFPAAGATAESGPTLFAPYMTCGNTFGINAYIRTGPPAAWAAWQATAGGYVSIDASANMSLATGPNPGAGAPLTMGVRLALYGAGYTYSQPRFLAYDGSVAGQTAIGCYQTSLGSAEGWVLAGAGGFYQYSLDGVGGVSGSSKLTINRNGMTSIGPSAAMAFYYNGSAYLLQFDGNSYIQYVPATGRSYFVQAGGTPMNLPANGNLEVAGGAPFKPAGGPWSATSDRRVKQDIRPYEAGLDEILALKPSWYQYRPETHMSIVGEDKVGLIAQEVITVLPECVTVGPREEGELSYEDMHTFDSGPILYALINAVKELKAQNDALHDRIKTLEAA